MKVDSKTNAMRILESLSVPYSVHSYEFDEDHLDAVHAAESLGLEKERVFKTIVMKNNENRVFVFCLPCEFSVSLKKARALTESKELDLLPLSDLRKTTGYIRGGCSPLGMTRSYPTFIEETALLEDTICISAGERGRQIEIKPEDLREAAGAIFADFVQ